MKQGDFTELARSYVNRAGYSDLVLRAIALHVGALGNERKIVADVGAGTGKLTENLAELGLKNITAVEPNDAMRTEGEKYTSRFKIDWRKGSGEETGLESASVDWLLMGSSFHWVDLRRGLNEFHRVIRPGGSFTALWNPRDLVKSELHQNIEARIYSLLPTLERVSSGSAKYTATLESDLVSTGQFADVLFMEASHEVIMPRDRYLGAWRSVNDIQAQAGPELFERIMAAIEDELGDRTVVAVPYRTRAWTVRRTGP